MPAHPGPVDIAVSFLTAWAAGDLTTIAGYVADDIIFERPRVQLAGAENVLAAMVQFAQVVGEVNILAASGDDEQTAVVHEMETGPFGTLKTADHYLVRDSKLSPTFWCSTPTKCGSSKKHR